MIMWIILSVDGTDLWLFMYGRLTGELEGLRAAKGNADETSKVTIQRYEACHDPPT